MTFVRYNNRIVDLVNILVRHDNILNKNYTADDFSSAVFFYAP